MSNLFIDRKLKQNIAPNAERKALRRTFRLCAFLLFFLLNGLFSVSAQEEHQPILNTWPDTLKPVFWSQNAYCSYDGEVFYALLYTEDDGATWDTVGCPGKKPLDYFHLERVRIFRQTNLHDTAFHKLGYYPGCVDTFKYMEAKTYYIGLEGAYITTEMSKLYEYVDTLTIPTDYKHPKSPSIVEVSTTEYGYGKRPTLGCGDETGRLQLKISGGRFPYKVAVDTPSYAPFYDLDSLAHYRDYYLTEPQNHGHDSLEWDYEGYFTIDSLPAYTWQMQITDGCMNSGQYTVEEVTIADRPAPDYIEVLAKPPHNNDSNIVQINLVLKSSQYEYYLKDLIEGMSYRFYWKNHCGSSVPGFKNLRYEDVRRTTGGKKYILFSDTICGNDYCDILNEDSANRVFVFEMEFDTCNDGTLEHRSFHREFVLEKPNRDYFDTLMHFAIDSIVPNGLCWNTEYGHNDYFRIRYRGDGAQHNTKNREDIMHRYHFTYPLVWTFEVKLGENSYKLVKSESITNIHNEVRLYAQTLIDSLEDVTGFPITDKTIRTVLTDAKGCVLYDNEENISLRYVERNVAKKVNWSVSKEDGDHCCVEDCVIILKEENTPLDRPLGETTISLDYSPYENLYNFSAVYDPIDMIWEEPHKDDYMNIASIYANVIDGSPVLEIRQPCLPSGTYSFKFISQGCGLMDTTVTFKFGEAYSTELVSDVHRTTTQRCSNLEVVYDGGQVNLVKQGTDPGNGADLDPVVVPCNTRIKVINGVVGGYSKTAVYGLNDEIHLTQPGQYVLEIKPVPPSGSLCEEVVFPYDTIEYAGGEIGFDYSVAMLCQNYDQQGNVYIKANNGAEPFTYNLFRGAKPDHGVLLASNHDGIFLDVDFTGADTLSCLVVDACNAIKTAPDIYPVVLANLQKVWFDNGGTEIELCEGQSVHVNALQYGNIFHFQWWYDTLSTATYQHDTVTVSTSSEPELFLYHSAHSGWYHVDIQNTGCYQRVEDSVLITVRPAPRIEIEEDATVCPNKPVTLRFTPRASDPNHEPDDTDTIFFKIFFSNANGIDTLDTFARPNQTVEYSYTSASNAKVYPAFIEENMGDHCGPYTVADPWDTVYITMDVANMLNLASIQGTDTIVCYNGMASLRARINASELEVDMEENPKFALNWYTDYAQTKPWCTSDSAWCSPDSVEGEQWTDFHDTANLTEQLVLFVAVDGVEGKCQATNGIANDRINFGEEDDTDLDEVTVFRFFDSGGETGNYATGELETHTFRTTDGSRVLLHFNSIELSNVSMLYVFSGPYTRADSLLFSYQAGGHIPDYILSHSNMMTIGFRADKQSAPGWDALIQHAPGIAVADIHPRAINSLKARVCPIEEALTCHPSYPYQDVLANVVDINEDPDQDSMDELVWAAMAGPSDTTYHFEGYMTDGDGHRVASQMNGCDSLVRFELIVKKPPLLDTTALITSFDSLVWRGRTYKTMGNYRKVVSNAACGCDTVMVLHLIVLETDIQPMDTTLCCDDSVKLVIGDIGTPDISKTGQMLPSIGDVLCSKLDGTGEIVLPPDTFLARVSQARANHNEEDELYPIGVVFDIEIDADGYNGKVIGLRDASDTVCQYSVAGPNVSYGQISTNYDGKLGLCPDYEHAFKDLDGEKNTNALKNCCETKFSGEDAFRAFMMHAPAAAMCYYYDHKCCYIGSTYPTTGTRHQGWYLPAAGELYRYFIRRDIVNSTLKLLKENGYGAKLPYEDFGDLAGVQIQNVNGVSVNGNSNDSHEIDCKYHTSTEYNKTSSSKSTNIVYRLDYKGMLNFKHEKYMNEMRLNNIDDDRNNVHLTNITVQGTTSSYSYYIHRARAVRKFRIYTE